MHYVPHLQFVIETAPHDNNDEIVHDSTGDNKGPPVVRGVGRVDHKLIPERQSKNFTEIMQIIVYFPSCDGKPLKEWIIFLSTSPSYLFINSKEKANQNHHE